MTFDDDTLLPNGGLSVAALLAQKLEVADLVDEHVTVAGELGANGGAKAATVIGTALAGGDYIDDARVLQAGATKRLFDGVRAPSTIGIWLRAFIWASVRQLDRVTRELLRRAWQAGLGPVDLAADLTIDIDSSVVETYGLAKQGGQRFAYAGVRGYHPLVASLAQTGELLHARLRGGAANTGRGAASFVAETISRVRHAGATGALTLRADSGFYTGAVISACRRHGVRYSVTARKNRSIQRAIDAIAEHDWIPIPYWLDGGADVAAMFDERSTVLTTIRRTAGYAAGCSGKHASYAGPRLPQARLNFRPVPLHHRARPPLAAGAGGVGRRDHPRSPRRHRRAGLLRAACVGRGGARCGARRRRAPAPRRRFLIGLGWGV